MKDFLVHNIAAPGVAGTPAARRPSIWLAWIVFGGLVIGYSAYFGPRYLRDRKEADFYDHSARCGDTAGKLARIQEAECRLVLNAEITHVYSKAAGRASVRMVRVRLPDGSARVGQLHDDEFWLSLESGQSVEVELWRDRMMRVRSRTGEAVTSGNPSWDRDNIAKGTLALVAMLSLVLGLLIWSTKRARRLRLA